MDSSDRLVVVTASLHAAPFDIKVWVYEPPKVSAASRICDILTWTFKAPVFLEKLLASPTVAPAPLLTWWDRITIAFLTFLYMLLFILVVFAVLFLVLPDISNISLDLRLLFFSQDLALAQLYNI